MARLGKGVGSSRFGRSGSPDVGDRASHDGCNNGRSCSWTCSDWGGRSRAVERRRSKPIVDFGPHPLGSHDLPRVRCRFSPGDCGPSLGMRARRHSACAGVAGAAWHGGWRRGGGRRAGRSRRSPICPVAVGSRSGPHGRVDAGGSVVDVAGMTVRC